MDTMKKHQLIWKKPHFAEVFMLPYIYHLQQSEVMNKTQNTIITGCTFSLSRARCRSALACRRPSHSCCTCVHRSSAAAHFSTRRRSRSRLMCSNTPSTEAIPSPRRDQTVHTVLLKKSFYVSIEDKYTQLIQISCIKYVTTYRYLIETLTETVLQDLVLLRYWPDVGVEVVVCPENKHFHMTRCKCVTL